MQEKKKLGKCIRLSKQVLLAYIWRQTHKKQRLQTDVLVACAHYDS